MKLTNRELYRTRNGFDREGKPVDALGVLLQMSLPWKASMEVVKLAQKLKEYIDPIQEVKAGLLKQYGTIQANGRPGMSNFIETKDEDGKVTGTEPNPQWPKFESEYEELMKQEVEVVFQPVALPEKVAATCDKCHHNMDKPLEIQPSILMVLEKFIKVA